MPISKTSSLILLINRLSKSEKRHFTLFLNRLDINNDSKTVALFKLIESKTVRNESEIAKKVGLSSAQQFSNLKRHLFVQVLISLRMLYANKNDDFELREYLDFAEILRSKALYKESLQLLVKCHNYNTKENYHMHQLIEENLKKVELETQVFDEQSQSYKSSAIQMTPNNNAVKCYEKTKQEFLKIGYSKNERENYFLNIVINERLGDGMLVALTAADRFKLNFQWALLNHSSFKDRLAYRYSMRAYENLKIIKQGTSLLFEHDLFDLILKICKAVNDIPRYKYWLNVYNKRLKFYQSSEDASNIFLRIKYYELSKVQLQIFKNNYMEANALLSQLINQYEEIDKESKSLLRAQLWFMKACICSDLGDYDEAIKYSFKLTQYNVDPTNKDYILYARLIHLMCNYRLNNLMFVENNITNVRNAFIAQDSLTKTIDALLVFLRKGVRAHNFGLKDEINDLNKKLILWRQMPFEKVSFYFYDFNNYLNSLKFNVSVQRYNEIKESKS